MESRLAGRPVSRKSHAAPAGRPPVAPIAPAPPDASELVKYKTLFRVILKLIGVYLCLQATVSFFSLAASMLLRNMTQNVPLRWTQLTPGLIGFAIRGACGLYLFLGGNWIVNLAIPGNRPYCPECGYDLSGAPGKRCPECGTPINWDEVRPPRTDQDAASTSQSDEQIT